MGGFDTVCESCDGSGECQQCLGSNEGYFSCCENGDCPMCEGSGLVEEEDEGRDERRVLYEDREWDGDLGHVRPKRS